MDLLLGQPSLSSASSLLSCWWLSSFFGLLLLNVLFNADFWVHLAVRGIKVLNCFGVSDRRFSRAGHTVLTMTAIFHFFLLQIQLVALCLFFSLWQQQDCRNLHLQSQLEVGLPSGQCSAIESMRGPQLQDK